MTNPPDAGIALPLALWASTRESSGAVVQDWLAEIGAPLETHVLSMSPTVLKADW